MLPTSSLDGSQMRRSEVETSPSPQNSQQIPTPPSVRPLLLNRNHESGARGRALATRPQPEDIYSEMETYFPDYDLDKPFVAESVGNSLTAEERALQVPMPQVPAEPQNDEKARNSGKKSIRTVAEEHRELVNSTSGMNASSQPSRLRVRNTKLWGSKLEEVTTSTAAGLRDLPSSGKAASNTVSTGNAFKWVRGELIGRGTYGRVYLAPNAMTGEMVVVKQLELDDSRYSHQVMVLQALKMGREALVYRALDHPNIVQYLGFEENSDNLNMFFEYVPGSSIGDCLRKHGKFQENTTKSFTGQILAGLEYLHSQGIPHRNLNADNILLEMSGVCKISNLDLSGETEDGGVLTFLGGSSVYWMAPEVIRTGKKGYKADIWSVGCVVLEMWTAMRAWLDEEVPVVINKLYQMSKPPLPEDVTLSEEADDFRQKCFAINPEERPSASELQKHRYLTLPPDWIFTMH